MDKELQNHKFTWGDTVFIKKNAPPHLHPGEIGSVCSVIKIDPEDVEKQTSLIEPTWLYTVEFSDGSSIELPECYLEPYVKENEINPTPMGPRPGKPRVRPPRAEEIPQG